MKIYEKVSIIILSYEANDVITSSLDLGNGDCIIDGSGDWEDFSDSFK